MATALFGMGWGQEESMCHLWNHLKFKNIDGLTKDFVRGLVETVYDEELAARKQQPPLAVPSAATPTSCAAAARKAVSFM